MDDNPNTYPNVEKQTEEDWQEWETISMYLFSGAVFGPYILLPIVLVIFIIIWVLSVRNLSTKESRELVETDEIVFVENMFKAAMSKIHTPSGHENGLTLHWPNIFIRDCVPIWISTFLCIPIAAIGCISIDYLICLVVPGALNTAHYLASLWGIIGVLILLLGCISMCCLSVRKVFRVTSPRKGVLRRYTARYLCGIWKSFETTDVEVCNIKEIEIEEDSIPKWKKILFGGEYKEFEFFKVYAVTGDGTRVNMLRESCPHKESALTFKFLLSKEIGLEPKQKDYLRTQEFSFREIKETQKYIKRSFYGDPVFDFWEPSSWKVRFLLVSLFVLLFFICYSILVQLSFNIIIPGIEFILGRGDNEVAAEFVSFLMGYGNVGVILSAGKPAIVVVVVVIGVKQMALKSSEAKVVEFEKFHVVVHSYKYKWGMGFKSKLIKRDEIKYDEIYNFGVILDSRNCEESKRKIKYIKSSYRICMIMKDTWEVIVLSNAIQELVAKTLAGLIVKEFKMRK